MEGTGERAVPSAARLRHRTPLVALRTEEITKLGIRVGAAAEEVEEMAC
jgi:hypothetical protein